MWRAGLAADMLCSCSSSPCSADRSDQRRPQTELRCNIACKGAANVSGAGAHAYSPWLRPRVLTATPQRACNLEEDGWRSCTCVKSMATAGRGIVGWSSTGYGFHTRAMASLQEVRSCISSKVRSARVPAVVSVHTTKDRAFASHQYRSKVLHSLDEPANLRQTQQDASTI